MINRPKRIKPLFLTAIAAICLGGNASADLLFEESFSYFTGNLAGSTNPSSGTNWAAHTNSVNNAVALNSLAPSGYGGLDSSGNQLFQTASGRVSLDISSLTSITNPAPGSTLYISFLQQFGDDSPNNSKIIELWRGAPSGGNTVFSFGKDTNGVAPDYGLLIEKDNANAIGVAAGSPNTSTNLVVIRVDYGTGGTADQVRFYVNPNNGTTEPNTADGSDDNSADFDFSFNRIGFGAFQGGIQSVDEIRIATTFAEAIPGRIVEPGLVFEESFSYPTGSLIGNTNTSSATNWANVSGGANNDVSVDELTPSSLPGLVTSGNSLTQTTSSRASLDLSGISEITSPPAGSSLYVSFIQKFGDSAASNTKVLELWRGDATSADTVFAFGKDTNGTAPDYGLLIEKDDANAVGVSGGDPNTNTNLVVLRIDYGLGGSPDSIRFYINPGASEPTTPDGINTNTADFDFTFNRIGFGTFQSGTQAVDEIRIATNYSASLPVQSTVSFASSIAPLDSSSSGSLSSEAPLNTSAGTISLISPTNETIANATFQLVAGTGDSDNGSFTIVGDELQVTADLSSKVDTTLSVRIQATGPENTIQSILSLRVFPPDVLPAGIQLGSLSKYLNGNFPASEPSPGSGAYITTDAFPNLSFGELIGITVEPRSNFLYVLERDGDVFRVENDPTTTIKTEVLSVNVTITTNSGFRSFVAHPEFNLEGSAHKDEAFIFYSTTSSGQFVYRLSRVIRDSNGIFGSEQVMLQQHAPDGGQHFAGSLVFDQDGFLMVGLGDMEISQSGTGVPLYQDVQRMDRIFQGKILRLDVDMQGGGISFPATRTLSGGIVNGINTDQSCFPGHAYYSSQNFSGVGYFIPADNYFVLNPPAAGTAGDLYPAHGDALQESHALGVRNPWRMAYDPVDHDIVWFSVGSNGSERYEEIDLLTPGGNYGWPFAESTFSDSSETGRTTPPSLYAPTYLGVFDNNDPKQTDPLWSYNVSPGSNDENRAVSGGVMYRGTLFPDLVGKLIYGDSASGRIWSLDYKNKTKANFVNTELIDSSVLVRQMTAGPQGQKIYIVDGSGVFLLTTDTEGSPEPPALLSETGAFSDLATLTPSPGLIPYTPASPLWSDRADKSRWVALPNAEGVAGMFDAAAEKIVFSEDHDWTFPVGTVFIKQFNLPLDERDPNNPNSMVRLETRFLIFGENNEYYGVTYKWRPDGTEADLLTDGDSENFTITSPTGSEYQQTWDYPSRQNCFSCHQAISPALGLKTRQLNHSIFYPQNGTTANQLSTLRGLQAFSDPSFDIDDLKNYLKSASIASTTDPLEHRVRSYLDANCAMCHQPGADSGRASFDARLITPLNLSGMIDQNPGADSLGIIDAKIISPGNPDKSILFVRDGLTGTNQMPPLARNVPHSAYLKEVEAWIRQLGLPQYQQWVTANNVLGNWDGDDDNDRSNNLFEYIVGTDPQSRASYFQPSLANDFTFSLPVSGNSRTDDVGIQIQDSANLIDWFNTGETGSKSLLMSDTSSPGVDGTLKIQLLSDEPKRFIRAAISP